MKTVFKRWLLLGMSISFMVLAAIRSWGEPEPVPSPNPVPTPESSSDSKPGSGSEPAGGGPAEEKTSAEPAVTAPAEQQDAPPSHQQMGPQLLGPQLVQSPAQGSARPLRSEPALYERPAITVSFSGIVVRSPETPENCSHFALRETAGNLYPLDSDTRALPWEGESVRVTGNLDVDTRMLHIDMIQPSLGRLMRRA